LAAYPGGKSMNIFSGICVDKWDIIFILQLGKKQAVLRRKNE